MSQDWRSWHVEVGLTVAVLLLGVSEMTQSAPQSRVGWGVFALIVAATAAAVGLCRRVPALALLLVWVVFGLQVITDTQVLLTQLAVAIVAFGAARWGSTATLLVSGLSIPAAVGAIVAVFILGNLYYFPLPSLSEYRLLTETVFSLSDAWQAGVAVLGMVVLGAPWLAGLALRFNDRAAASRTSQLAAQAETARATHDAEQAREIAQLREDQARLARDVHDVVGHSLAVILAQAESAQYVQDADTQKLKQTMENIATSARSSLQDVRRVLTPSPAETAQPGSLDALVNGVRESGHEVVSSEVGSPQPLPPELDVVAYRVLQEMLTNAIKHGRRDEPVFVERHWEGELRIEVRNVIDAEGEESVSGQGLDGMRRRLESVGGRLDVRRRVEAGRATFTTTAWVPVRSR